MDRGNGTPEPTIGTGASVTYSYDNGTDYRTLHVNPVFGDTEANAIAALAIRDAGTYTNVPAIYCSSAPSFVLTKADGSDAWGTRVQNSNFEVFVHAGGSSANGLNLIPPSGGGYMLSGSKVVGARDTGWTAMTGSTNKATSYATSSVTLAQLAGRVMALQEALTTHGLIGS